MEGVGSSGGVHGPPGSVGIPRVRPVPMEKRFSYSRVPSTTTLPQSITTPDPEIDYNVVGLSYSGTQVGSVGDIRVPDSPVFEASSGGTPGTGATSPRNSRPDLIRSNNSSASSLLAADTSKIAAHGGTIVIPPDHTNISRSLHHADFLPNHLKSKKDDEFERFSVLIERANQWSVQNPQCLVFSCETVTWTGVDRTIFTDSGIMTKSMHSDKKTKVLRGLRVWYFVCDDTFYDKSSSPGPFKLGCINYTLDGKADTIHTLLAKINGDMFKRSVAGKILKIETLVMLSDIADCDVTAWTEQPDKARDYVTFIRLFYVFNKDGMEDCKYGDIGFQDFIPFYDQRTPHNQGYEVFSELWSKASRWIYLNPHLSCINAQGLFVKLKKDSQPVSLWDRCNHREHGSAYGSLTHQKTEYFQILRIVYHKHSSLFEQPGNIGGGNGAGCESNEDRMSKKKLYYKTFSPSTLPRAVSSSGGEDQDVPAPAPIEGLYEDLRQLEEKTNTWLAISNGNVINVETVTTRLMSGGQEMLGPESTFVYNDREKNQMKEIWRVNIRLYVDGEFKNSPATLTNRYEERRSSQLDGRSAL